MKYSLRKTPSHLHLAYKYGEPGGGVLARNILLEVEGSELTLDVDLSANLKARNKSSGWYVAMMQLVRNRHKLRSLQCADNLVRARLIRWWEQVPQPRLRLRLDLGEHGRFLYDVSPHSLFTGGVQLDVRSFMDEQPPSTPQLAHESEGEGDDHRHHA